MPISKEKRLKWDSKSEKGIFVGYGNDIKGCRIYFHYKKCVHIKRNIISMRNMEDLPLEN